MREPYPAPRDRRVSRVRAGSARRPQFDYTAVGHVTIDVLADGSRRPGGGAFYSGLQAARLGQRTLVVTRGVPGEIEALLAPFASELTLHIVPAPRTTTLESNAGARAQRLLAWAGPIEAPRELDTEILHLAPVARECVTILKGNWRTMRIVHRPEDTASRVRLDGAAIVAAGLARVLRQA